MKDHAEAQGPPETVAVRRRLFLHVGLPKTGSTSLQAVLAGNRAALRAHGYSYPYVRPEAMFHAAVEMTGEAARWGLDPDEIRGTFSRLLKRGQKFGGDVIISHELLGSARPERIRAIGDLVEDFDLHLVITVRDLGRALPAQWQERVKNGRSQSFDEHAARLLGSLSDSPTSKVFWRSQNLPDLLERWHALVPPERTHLVVCPARGAAADVLWKRFAEAIGLPPDAVDLSAVPVANPSLGIVQIGVLRRVLDALDGRLEQPWRARIAKRWFAQSLLARTTSAKAVTPAPVAERLAELSHAWIDLVRAGGYPVQGDLDELVPDIHPDGSPHPDSVDPAELLDCLTEVVAEMLLETRDLRLTVDGLTAENAALGSERDTLAAQVVDLTEISARRRRRRRRWRWRRQESTWPKG